MTLPRAVEHAAELLEDDVGLAEILAADVLEHQHGQAEPAGDGLEDERLARTDRPGDRRPGWCVFAGRADARVNASSRKARILRFPTTSSSECEGLLNSTTPSPRVAVMSVPLERDHFARHNGFCWVCAAATLLLPPGVQRRPSIAELRANWNE